MINTGLANAIVAIVTAVWVVSFAAAIILPDYQPDPQINLIFAAIVGSAMALQLKTTTKPDGHDKDPS